MNQRRHSHRPRRAVGIALAILLAGTAACSDDSAPTTESSPPTTMAGDTALEITAVDFAFEGAPDEVDAGVSLALKNRSETEVHELVALRLADGERRPASALVQLPEHQLRALFVGPPALVLIAPPAGEGSATVGDGSLAEPGRYLFMCFIPTGAEPAAYLEALEAHPGRPPAVPGGPPHFSAGMFTEVTVR